MKNDSIGTICDLYAPILTDEWIKGNYKIVVKNISKYPYLPDVLGVGVKINLEIKKVSINSRLLLLS
jgi:hypothetical protein